METAIMIRRNGLRRMFGKFETRPRSNGAGLRGWGVMLLMAAAPVIGAAADRSAVVDESRVRAAGIRKLEGKRLTLYTDLPPAAMVDELPEAFDQAFPQWCAYFGVESGAHADWRMTGCLIKDKLRFQASGLMPDDLPPFLNGFS